MASTRITRRLVICVDGTWYSPDGVTGYGNNSNIFRMSVVAPQGRVRDKDGREYEQIVRYFNGIGFHDTPFQRFNVGVTGKGCEEQIKTITKECCEVLDQPGDELWLYGYSRGAYVVRAVAGLFHHMRALSAESLQNFDKSYDAALQLYPARQRLAGVVGVGRVKSGQIFEHLSRKTREPPIIKFLGVFDTVKATTGTLHDISFVDSIQNCRHALALNENRRVMTPEFMSPDLGCPHLEGCSFVQAWFLGAHADLGGGCLHDGLSLYPLQWMLLESLRCGLVLGFNPEPSLRNIIEDPLELVFPGAPNDELDSDDSERFWSVQYKNSMSFKLQDIRITHAHHKEHAAGASSHHIRLNQGKIALNVAREAFRGNTLIGHSEHGPNGTVVHPSVFFVLDVYANIAQNPRIKYYSKPLANFRSAEMGDDQEIPWVLDWELAQRLALSEVKAFRILVLGHTGVGKSTLINKVFGTDLTGESLGLDQGIHDIDRAFESDSHPGLLIHDSRGYQSGSSEELKLIEGFIRKRCSNAKPKEVLHAIWFCLDSSAVRIEKGDLNIFEVIAKHAAQVPIIVVGTKKDALFKLHLDLEHVDMSNADTFPMEVAKARHHAEAAVSEKQAQIQESLEKQINGQSVEYVYVAQNDSQSIRQLVSKTLENIDDENVRLFCVAAQIVDLDQKIDSAITESLRLGRHAIRTAITPLPFTGAVATPTVSRILCQRVLQCFGFPKVSNEGVDELMSKLVWGNSRQFMTHSTLYFLGVSGIVTGLTFGTGVGGIVFGVVTCILAAPPTARMILKCACDVILILERAFLSGGKFVTEAEIKNAAIQHLETIVNPGDQKKRTTVQQKVHAEVDVLIPLWSIHPTKSAFGAKFGKLQFGLEEIVERNRQGKRQSAPAESVPLSPSTVELLAKEVEFRDSIDTMADDKSAVLTNVTSSEDGTRNLSPQSSTGLKAKVSRQELPYHKKSTIKSIFGKKR